MLEDEMSSNPEKYDFHDLILHTDVRGCKYE